MILMNYQSLPITHNILINWIAHESKSNKNSIIKQYISILHSKHIDMNLLIIVFFESSITCILTRIAKTQDIHFIHERLEIIKNILLKMLSHIDISTFNNMNFYVSFCIAFADFFRSNEFTWDKWNFNISSIINVSRNSVQFTSDETIIHFLKSKMNQLDQDINLTLSFANDASYSIQTLHQLFKRYSCSNSNSLFACSIKFFSKHWFA